MTARTSPETRADLARLVGEWNEFAPTITDYEFAVYSAEALPGLLADLADAEAERDALAATVERVRALHYEADNTPSREPVCDQCHGKAGVHGCGCWADEDREPICGCCRGTRGASVPWPCPTIRALDGEG